MRHKEIERLIQKSLDGETRKGEERSLRRHLSHCPGCQKFYEELSQTQRSISGLIEFFPDHDFNNRLLRRLGFKKSYLWQRAAIILAGGWLGSFLLFIISPLARNIFGQILTSVPEIMRLLNKIEIIFSSFTHILKPFAKGFFNPAPLVIGLVSAVFIIYLFGKTIKKEVKWRV